MSFVPISFLLATFKKIFMLKTFFYVKNKKKRLKQNLISYFSPEGNFKLDQLFKKLQKRKKLIK